MTAKPEQFATYGEAFARIKRYVQNGSGMVPTLEGGDWVKASDIDTLAASAVTEIRSAASELSAFQKELKARLLAVADRLGKTAMPSETACSTEAERYRKGMENWKATAEQKDRDFTAHVAAMREKIIEECKRVADDHERRWRGVNVERAETAGDIGDSISALKNAAPQVDHQGAGTSEAGDAGGKPSPAGAAPSAPSAELRWEPHPNVQPDGSAFETVLASVRQCAAGWVPEARLVGNVRAGDIVRAINEVEQRIAVLNAAASATAASTERDYKALYLDLIMQVGNKWPDETRHDTAKRYIVQAEAPKASDQIAASDSGKADK